MIYTFYTFPGKMFVQHVVVDEHVYMAFFYRISYIGKPVSDVASFYCFIFTDYTKYGFYLIRGIAKFHLVTPFLLLMNMDRVTPSKALAKLNTKVEYTSPITITEIKTI